MHRPELSADPTFTQACDVRVERRRRPQIVLSCFDVVPDDTRPWKPLIAPHAIVTNRIGKMEGAPASGLR